MRNLLNLLFIPHPVNNHRAKILHQKILLSLIAFFAFSSVFFPSGLNPFSSKIQAFADISVKELLNYTNQNRAVKGLPRLSDDPQLDRAAANKAKDMFAKNYWAHDAPDGTTPWFFITQAGYSYVYAGENLARGFNSSKDVVDAWMASPDHRANILSPNYKDVGFAVMHGNLSGEETFLVVQEFGNKSIIPAATPVIDSGDKVLGFSVNSQLKKLETFSLSLSVVVAVLGIFMATLLLDVMFLKRRKIERVVGHSLDHFMFLSVIVLITLIFGLGQVL